MPEDPDLSDRIPERREQFNDVRRHEATRHAHQRHGRPPQVRIRQRLAVVPLTDTLGRLRQVNAASVEVIRAEGRIARREVDLHLLGVAAAAWGCLWCRGGRVWLVRSLLLRSVAQCGTSGRRQAQHAVHAYRVDI